MAETGNRSFIENVNIIANATALATGDVIEDANRAKDAAEVSAAEALTSANNADISESLAQAWAVKAYNNPVSGSIGGGDASYSSYHWSIVSGQNAAPELIDDNIVSLAKTWSSEKVNEKLNEKSTSDHTHLGVYEPVFTKKTGFNKDFKTGTDSGIADTVSRGDHSHGQSYEPIIDSGNTKGTAFNKNFGISSGEVSEGDHNHTDTYMPKSAIQTAYNKPFVLNTDTPGSEEIPRGTHVHPATKVTHDPSGNTVALSTTVQGAIGQLDSKLSIFELSEKCKLNSGMTNALQTVNIATAGVGVKLVTAMTVSAASKNTLYSGGDLTINYPEDPNKLIEGWYSSTVTIHVLANKEYAIALWVNDVIGNTAFRATVGSATNNVESYQALSLDGFLSGIQNGDRLSIGVYNLTDNVDADIHSHTVSFAGEPEGSIIASGTSVDHADITGTGAANGVHITSDIQDLDINLLAKTDKIVPVAAGNIAMLDINGNLADSGHASTEFLDHMTKVTTPILDNIIIQTSAGDSKDGGLKITDLALAGGNNAQVFEVAPATADTHAVTKLLFDTEKALVATKQELIDHTALVNPHGTTASDIGASETVHTHTINDTTGLQDAINLKYDEVGGAAQNNIVVFGIDELIDSGLNTSNLTTKTSDVGSSVLPVGTSAQQDIIPEVGYLRFNTDLISFEGYNGIKWGSIGGGAKGGDNDDIFYENAQNVTANYTITTNKNAMSAGPITIDDGITITIPDGSSWTIVGGN